MKKILFIITLLLLSITNVNAEACDAYDIKRLKEIAEGVEITYELQEPEETDYGKIMDLYKIYITGLTDEIHVKNETDQKFYYYNTNFSELESLSSGKKKFVVKSQNCTRELRKITINLPLYNGYHNSEICKENSDLSICQEWVEEKVEEKQIFQLNEEKDKTNNKQDKFIEKNIKPIIIASLIIVIIIVIIIVVRRKRSVLE